MTKQVNITVKVFGVGAPPADLLTASCAVEFSTFSLLRTSSGAFEGTHLVEDDGNITVSVGVTAPSHTQWQFSVQMDPADRPAVTSGVNTIPAGSIKDGDTIDL